MGVSINAKEGYIGYSIQIVNKAVVLATPATVLAVPLFAKLIRKLPRILSVIPQSHFKHAHLTRGINGCERIDLC